MGKSNMVDATCEHCHVTGKHIEYPATNYAKEGHPLETRRVCQSCKHGVFIAPAPVQATETPREPEPVPVTVAADPPVETPVVQKPKRTRTAKPKVELTDEEMAGIAGLAEDDGRLFGGDPDSHEEM